MTELPGRCIDPAAITADDRIAYARGEAQPSIIAHIAHCPACDREVAGYARVERLFRRALFRRSCPDSIVLGEYALTVLSPEDRRRVAEHLIDCAHCRDEVAGFGTFLTETDVNPAPSAMGLLRRLIARALPSPAPALSGLRGDGESGSVTYEAGGVRLTVSVQSGPRPGAGNVLVGLVEQSPRAGGVATLYQDGAVVAREDVDEIGHFLFEGIPNGSYRVEVSVPPLVVVIERLDIA
jgi:hypothetical protein